MYILGSYDLLTLLSFNFYFEKYQSNYLFLFIKKIIILKIFLKCFVTLSLSS